MIVYGRNAVREALRGPRNVERLWVADPDSRFDVPAGIDVVTATRDELDELSHGSPHQGVIARVEEFRYASPESLLEVENAFLLVLDGIQDPQNLGAICRVAEGAGMTGVVIPRHRAADVTGAVCRASSGAVEHIPVARVRNIADFLVDARQAGVWRYGAAAGGDESWDGADWKGPVALVMGAEGKGLRPRVAGECDLLVSLPLLGKVESLNVATAAAAIAYEAVRQRRA